MLARMAREESDREDLLREATALVERIELAPIDADSSDHVVAGFRSNGAASFFFGSEPVYQFNAAGELRRAFWNGVLIKASRGKLVSLRRRRLEHETQLVSRELSDDEQSDFIVAMSERLRTLASYLADDRYRIVGQVPSDADVLDRVRNWLAEHIAPSIANSPRAEA
jgi:hypothetical protein